MECLPRRDRPPRDALFTIRSRALSLTERDDRHVQVNRPLLAEFTAVLARAEWDVLLLQEAPPRWHRALCARLGATGAIGLTSRNSLAPLRALLARLNPDLIASGEGGSNQVLVRPPWRVAEVRRMVLTERPERRTMLFTRLEREEGGPMCVANLHASLEPRAAERELTAAAGRAVAWAGGAPLVLGGDFNLWPSRSPAAFAELADRHGLEPPTAPGAIDHLLARGVSVETPPRALPDAWREVPAAGHAGRSIRLSDHAAVAARFTVG